MAKRAEGTTEKLLASARREFSRHGFANASLRTIALDSGVTTHTVYTRFGSKEGLFAALVGPAAGKFMETLMAGYDRYFDMGNESIRERELFSHSVYEELVDLMFDNRDAFMLLLDASAGTAFEQAMGEAAGGHAHVQRVQSGAVDAGGIERGVELVAAPRDEAAGAGSRHTQRLVGKDRLGCAGNGCFTARAFGEHGSLVDEAPRQRAGFDQPARDQFDVGPGGHQ